MSNQVNVTIMWVKQTHLPSSQVQPSPARPETQSVGDRTQALLGKVGFALERGHTGLDTDEDHVGTEENTLSFIPVSLPALPGRPGGLVFRIREAGTSVNSDFSSWKCKSSGFHLETIFKERDNVLPLVRKSGLMTG